VVYDILLRNYIKYSIPYKKNQKNNFWSSFPFYFLSVFLINENLVSKYEQLLILNPKGRTIPTRDNPVLGSVAWSRTSFRFFIFIFPNASRNKLRVSTNFIILGAMDQNLWVFENFRRSLGRAGIKQQELTTCAKICRQEEGEIWQQVV
jgi:hypothetical protein